MLNRLRQKRSKRRLRRNPKVTINRVPDVPYAQIANSALRDSSLSFRARGILALVLSNAGEWKASRGWLESQSDKEGREAVQRALNELTEKGYRIVHKEQDALGKWSSWVEWTHAPNDWETDRPETRPSVQSAAIKKTIKENYKEGTPANLGTLYKEIADAS